MRGLLGRHQIKTGGQMSIGELGRLFSVGIVCFAIGLMIGLYSSDVAHSLKGLKSFAFSEN